jgi:hypothetical protein
MLDRRLRQRNRSPFAKEAQLNASAFYTMAAWKSQVAGVVWNATG